MYPQGGDEASARSSMAQRAEAGSVVLVDGAASPPADQLRGLRE